MPTFVDPQADVLEALDALQGLVHASRVFDHPQDLYVVLGEVLPSVRSLRQVCDQLADSYTDSRPHAFDEAEGHLSTAMSAARRIAWHVSPTRTRRQWIGFIFLDGSQADEVLDLIQREDPSAGIEYLKQWDYGDETTSEVLVNGHVYDEPRSGSLECTTTEGEYTLTYSPFLGQVGLLRARDIPLNSDPLNRPALSGEHTPKPTTPGRAVKEGLFTGPSGSSQSPAKGLGL